METTTTTGNDTYYALRSDTGEMRHGFSSKGAAACWLAEGLGVDRSDLHLQDRHSSCGTELRYEVTRDGADVGTIGNDCLAELYRLEYIDESRPRLADGNLDWLALAPRSTFVAAWRDAATLPQDAICCVSVSRDGGTTWESPWGSYPTTVISSGYPDRDRAAGGDGRGPAWPYAVEIAAELGCTIEAPEVTEDDEGPDRWTASVRGPRGTEAIGACARLRMTVDGLWAPDTTGDDTSPTTRAVLHVQHGYTVIEHTGAILSTQGTGYQIWTPASEHRDARAAADAIDAI